MLLLFWLELWNFETKRDIGNKRSKEIMGKILDALAFDMLRVEVDVEERSPEHKELNKKVDECQEELGKRLNKEEKELFDKLMNLLSRDSAYYAAERFTYGFRLGARFTAESLLDMEGLIGGEAP